MTDIARTHCDTRMSQIVTHGGVAYLSGQVAPDFLDGPAPVPDQTRKILARIDELLAQAGTDKSRLLTAQIWLADVAEFDAMNAVWENWLVAHQPPARATCGVTLAHPNVRIEITVSAAL